LSYTLVLGSGQPAEWTVVDRSDVPLDNNKVDTLAGNLADLEGSEFVHGQTDTGLDDPAARILIGTVDNRDFRLLVGADAGDNQYYLGVDNGKYAYKVSEWRLQGILKDLEDLERSPSE
jgi:hypothetical protein